MKKILLGIVLLGLFFGGVWAQAPENFRYEVVVRDANGLPVAPAAAGVRISVLKHSPNGSVAYSEKHTATIGNGGLLSLEVGGGTRIGAKLLGDINWASDNYYLKVEIDLNGGNDYTLNMVSPVTAVPMVAYAQSYGKQNYSYHDFTDTPTVVSNFINDAGYLTHVDETQMLAISGDTISISGVAGYVVLPDTVSLDTLFAKADTLGRAMASNCLPEVITFVPQNVTSSSAELTAEIQGAAQGGAPTSKGICWALHSAPTENDNVIFSNDAAVLYTIIIPGLSSSQTCFVRAFAKYGDTVVYGNEVMFKTM